MSQHSHRFLRIKYHVLYQKYVIGSTVCEHIYRMYKINSIQCNCSVLKQGKKAELPMCFNKKECVHVCVHWCVCVHAYLSL